MPGKRKTAYDVDRLGAWYEPSKHHKVTRVDKVTAIMAPRSSVTGAEARDKVMANTLRHAPKIGHRKFTTKKAGRIGRRKNTKKGGWRSQPIRRVDTQELVPYDPDLRPEGGIGDFVDAFVPGFIKGFDTTKKVAEHIPGVKEAAEKVPSLGGGKFRKVHRLMPRESKIGNCVGSGMHIPVPDLKMNPEMRKVVAMVTGESPLDKHAKMSVSNIAAYHNQLIKNYKHHRKLPGLNLRRKITKGGRTFTTLKNILVTPLAAP